MHRQHWIFIVICILNFYLIQDNNLVAQNQTIKPTWDTIHITPDSVIVFKDSVLIPLSDTIILIEKGTHYKIRKNHYNKSRAFYDSLYYKTHDKKLTREIYSLVLTHRPEEQSPDAGKHSVAKNPFEKYKGKTIRSVRFVKVNILEGSVEDTLQFAVTGFGRFLNKTHINTRDWVLRKFMLVDPGEQIIPAILADNERVIRELPGIEDVRFLVVPDTLNEENVDLIVITKDIFPLGVSATASSFDKFSASLWDNNALGLAFELGGKIMYDSFYRNPWGYELKTNYRNFMGTFINGSLTWFDAFDAQWFKTNFSKGFITPQTKYGGGLNMGWIRDKYELSNSDTIITGKYESNYQDVWLGRSILLGDRDSRNNLIFSARYQREEFTQRPYINPDSNVAYHNKNIYFGKIAFSRLNYYKTSMIRAFGISEDIPYGFNAGLTGAYMEGDFLHRFYLGVNIGAGQYFEKLGYLSGSIIMGGFYKNGYVSQGLFESNIFYYTPLIKANRYSSRSFLHVRYRQAITKDVQTTIDFGENIRNLDQEYIRGISTMILNYEFVLFSPWYFYGFRFAPFVFADMGLISRSRDIFNKSRFFTAPGFGFRIRNESLAFKTIILSFGYIPNTYSGQGLWFYNFSMGEDPLISILNVEKPYILRRELIFPF